MRVSAIVGLIFALPSVVAAGSGLKPDQVPEFRLRARVVRVAGQVPEGQAYTFALAGANATARGSAWSTEIKFSRPQAEATLKGYPAIYLPAWPVVLRLTGNSPS